MDLQPNSATMTRATIMKYYGQFTERSAQEVESIMDKYKDNLGSLLAELSRKYGALGPHLVAGGASTPLRRDKDPGQEGQRERV